MTGPLAAGWPEPVVTDREDTLTGESGAAWFNEARTHRYMLVRRWSGAPGMTWLMLNPSTADAFADDPTIRRCAGFARREGCGGICVLNLYGVRSPDPAILASYPDPVGPSNDRFIGAYTQGDPVVAAWGSLGGLRGLEVGRRLAVAGVRLWCVGVTAAGQPRHPLYVRADAPLVPWEVPS